MTGNTKPPSIAFALYMVMLAAYIAPSMYAIITGSAPVWTRILFGLDLAVLLGSPIVVGAHRELS